jgi:hypothetical protein
VKNLVAKLEVVGVRESGERVELRLEIGRPREERDGRWACSIAIAPLKTQPDDVRGTDSFHAVWLACALVLKLLENLKADGWSLQNRDGSAFPLEAYRSGLGADAP